MSQPHRAGSSLRPTLGAATLLTSIVAAVAAPLIVNALSRALDEDVRGSEPVSAALVYLVEHRAWLPLLALPGVVCGLALLLSRRAGWSFFVIGSVFNLLLLAIVLWAIIGLVGPLYQYHPL